MKTIVFASWNSKKAIEMQRMTPDGIELLCLKDFPEAANIPQADENGTTFLENAIIKAKYWAEKINMPVLAEDSGIVIDALNKISSEYKKTIVMVTHDPQMASYCSRLILLKDGVILEDLKNSGDQETFYQEILGKMKEL